MGLIQIFAKAPILGEVKTRLASVVGDEAALKIHKLLCDKVISIAKNVDGVSAEIWCAGPDHGFFKSYDLPIFRQQGHNLGERLIDALHSGLQRRDRVLIVGGDAYSIDENALINAFNALDDAPVVLAPAHDGGYILVGATRLFTSMFHAVPWGTSDVLAVTVENLIDKKIPYQLLPEGWDIDTYEDLTTLAPELMSEL